MPCDVTRLGPDSYMIACTRGPRKIEKCACGRAPRFLCDGPAPPGSGRKTCDTPVCGRCATWARTKSDTHYCPEHYDLA